MIQHPHGRRSSLPSGVAARARRHSIPSGDVVLCSLPPYSTQPWLSMGVVLHSALLAQAGIRTRVVRPLDAPFVVPEGVADASLVTFARDPTIDQRLAAMDREYATSPAFFDEMVDELLAGGESVVGLSLFRNNADVSLQVARLLKLRKPEMRVILGGPEAIEEPTSLQLPFVDAVVSIDAEAVMVSLVRALLDRKPERAAHLRGVWLHPALAPGASRRGSLGLTASTAFADGYPTIDYAPLAALLVGDPEATMPLLLNWGCPYKCGFCSNRNVYSRFEAGSVSRVLEEIDAIMTAWAELHDGDPPGISLQLSDATTNALPAQLDDLLVAVRDRKTKWATRPHLRGQTLFDGRVTEERARLMRDGCFGSTFFGLESGSDRLRRALDKPASAAQVAAAMEAYHRVGNGGLHFGIPVGIPGETDEDFAETERFVERALRLEGTIETITVLPYAFFLTAQDANLCAENVGERRGVLWRTAGPGGDPATRARRFMRLFELVGGRVPVNSPFPPHLLLPSMLPETPREELDAWMARYGRSFDQLTPVVRPVPSDPRTDSLRVAIEAATPPEGWKLEAFDVARAGKTRSGLSVVFLDATGERRFCLQLHPLDANSPAFSHSRDFNVSYANAWKGLPCVFDAELMGWCAKQISAHERP